MFRANAAALPMLTSLDAACGCDARARLCWYASWRSARLPPTILRRDPMKVQWKKQSGPLLVSSVNLVSAKTRKRGADDDQSDPHRRVYRTGRAVPVPRLRAGEQRVEARVHDRARGPAARAHDAGARSRAADPGDRRRPAMVRPEGHHPSAELLRGGPRRVLAAPVRDFPRDRERGGGLVEHRSESTAPAREVGCPGCPQAARDAAALPRGRARRVERRARAHGRGGGSAPAASRAPDLEAGTHAGGEPDHRPARDPGYGAAAGDRLLLAVSLVAAPLAIVEAQQ